ncbi:MAG: hydroxymethylglutaryl-CoA lyase [Chitinophagaceae bacterium]|nr:MAG: hydroxymethylglutaryl-CoA lyase [Chitinophagaceae bacterium]
MANRIHVVECPRDAMQGWSHFIPTEAKIGYLNMLLQAGFDTIDFGSFVSPKLIPQMRDTKEVLQGLDLSQSVSKLLAIVANVRGAEEALQNQVINYLGYPFSVSPTFQLRNTNATMEKSLQTVETITNLCKGSGRKLVIYISMAFGNPYGDEYTPELVVDWLEKITAFGVDTISLADTVGVATPRQVFEIADHLVKKLPAQDFGVHLHSGPQGWQEKLQAALDAGCRRFDGAINGIGGCPMAGDALVGNMSTGPMLGYFESKGYFTGVSKQKLAEAELAANSIFI